MIATSEINHPLLQQGYVWRSVTPDDFAALATLSNLNNHASGLTSVTTVEEIEEEFSDSDFDIASSSRVMAAPDGSIILLATLSDFMQPPVRVFADMYAHPEHADLALRLEAHKWAENRAKEAIVRCPEEARVVMHSFCIGGYRPDEAALDTPICGLFSAATSICMIVRIKNSCLLQDAVSFYRTALAVLQSIFWYN